MLRRTTLFVWLAMISGAAVPAGIYSFHINWEIVTPGYLKKKAVPFQFEVSQIEQNLISVSIIMGPPTKGFGAASSCSLIVSTMPLPADETQELAWVKEGPVTKNQKKRIEITVPSTEKKEASRFLLLSRQDTEKAVFRVHYNKGGYGGDTYWVLLGRFLPNEKRG